MALTLFLSFSQSAHNLTENLTIHYETSLTPNFSMLDPNRLNVPDPNLTRPKLYCYHCDKVFRRDRPLRTHLQKETNLTRSCDL